MTTKIPISSKVLCNVKPLSFAKASVFLGYPAGVSAEQGDIKNKLTPFRALKSGRVVEC